ncbi:hypothetical protein D3C85_1013050 [compost metagenome]
MVSHAYDLDLKRQALIQKRLVILLLSQAVLAPPISLAVAHRIHLQSAAPESCVGVLVIHGVLVQTCMDKST